MKVVISVVSHYHFDLIKSLKCIGNLADKFDVFVIDNVKEDGFEQWCEHSNINYLSNDKKIGFGENNNKVFQAAYKEGGGEDCWFLVLNPDVIVSPEDVLALIYNMRSDNSRVATINLFRDEGFIKYDNSIRKFPSLTDFIKSYVTGNNPSVLDKDLIAQSMHVDWASGAFLMFDANLYAKLNGFDIRYYMYCEDIDICFRASRIVNERVMYYPSIKAVHLAAHSNRKLFSKNFAWHVRSIIRYLLVRMHY
ncbi:glycosyltransferase [Aeromonas taiwanensis]